MPMFAAVNAGALNLGFADVCRVSEALQAPVERLFGVVLRDVQLCLNSAQVPRGAAAVVIGAQIHLPQGADVDRDTQVQRAIVAGLAVIVSQRQAQLAIPLMLALDSAGLARVNGAVVLPRVISQVVDGSNAHVIQ